MKIISVIHRRTSLDIVMEGLADIQAKSFESSPAVNNCAKFYPCHVPVVSSFSGGALMDFHIHCIAHGGRKWKISNHHQADVSQP